MHLSHRFSVLILAPVALAVAVGGCAEAPGENRGVLACRVGTAVCEVRSRCTGGNPSNCGPCGVFPTDYGTKQYWDCDPVAARRAQLRLNYMTCEEFFELDQIPTIEELDLFVDSCTTDTGVNLVR